MDYKRIYDDLMQSRLLMKEGRIKLRKMGEYFEAHHIIPKSMGGEGKWGIKHTNLVLLTGREHYIAHALLWLIHRNREMAIAFGLMCSQKKCGRRNYVISSRMYEFAKKEINRLGRSAETKEKLRQASLGRKLSPEHLEKLRQSNLGKKMSPETREKLRQVHLGKKMSPEAKEKIRQFSLGRKLSPEAKEKLRQANLGKKLSPEHLEKLRQSNLGRKFSPESIEKIRQGNLGRKHSPETKEKLRQFSLGRKFSPESIEKRTETRKMNRLLKLAQLNGDIDWSRWEENK